MRSPLMKRLFDIFLSLFLLILFFPLMLIIAFLVYCFIGLPIIFKQQRPGLNNKPFLIYKFRTMKNTVDGNGTLLNDEHRLTRFGKFLRSTSLDELRELINVFIGNMSFVGPRPLMMEYLTLYNVEQIRRHDVRPGITGLAQINGRNHLQWEERFKLDVWYVDHWNLWLDFKILFRTIFTVIKREGISEEGQTTMSAFVGNTGSVTENENKQVIN